MLIGLLLAYVPISSLASLDPSSLTDRAAYHLGTVNRYGAILPLLLTASILLIPYADLLMAVFRRTRAGQSPFAADRKHLHHRMLDIGHSHRTSVLIMYLWAALFAGSVVWLSIVRTPLFVLAIVTVSGMLVLLFVSMPRLRRWARPAGAPTAGVRAATADTRRSAVAAAHVVHASPPADPELTSPSSPVPAAHAPARPARPARSTPAQPASSGRAPQSAFHSAPAPDVSPGAGLAGDGREAPKPVTWPAGRRASSPPWPADSQMPSPAPWPAVPQDPPAPPWPAASQASVPPWPPAPPAS
jgi:UDP-GlcNAc:undecaprenyl-phosphate GlcNAc-1-phosphate transferase